MNDIKLTENTVQSIADLARESAAPEFIEPGQILAVPDGQGGVRFEDTDKWDTNPRRATAHRRVLDAVSFNAYLHKHGIDLATEVWADAPNSKVIGRVNSHQGADRPAGWEDHVIELVLEHSKGWLEWREHNETWWTDQEEFAEFIETRAIDVQEPNAATLQEIILNFHASSGATFESTKRLSDGQVEFTYKEEIQASAGKHQLTIPSNIRLALQPYVGGPRVYINARFRYRVNGGHLKLGYVLERPQEVLDAAFDQILTEIRDGREASNGKPAIDGLASRFAIFHGRP